MCEGGGVRLTREKRCVREDWRRDEREEMCEGGGMREKRCVREEG